MKRKSKNDTRPSWDEYFMEIAQVVAKRSNCSRRKVAAVITKENHLLSTGYNGTPRGVKNCFDGGCPRCAGKTPSGKGLDECLCVHAEQNAICQAARYGVNVNGGTIYITLSTSPSRPASRARSSSSTPASRKWCTAATTRRSSTR